MNRFINLTEKDKETLKAAGFEYIPEAGYYTRITENGDYRMVCNLLSQDEDGFFFGYDFYYQSRWEPGCDKADTYKNLKRGITCINKKYKWYIA